MQEPSTELPKKKWKIMKKQSVSKPMVKAVQSLFKETNNTVRIDGIRTKYSEGDPTRKYSESVTLCSVNGRNT